MFGHYRETLKQCVNVGLPQGSRLSNSPWNPRSISWKIWSYPGRKKLFRVASNDMSIHLPRGEQTCEQARGR